MKETPLLYSGAMVRADLDDLKSMTRRVMKPQPVWEGLGNSQALTWAKSNIGLAEHLYRCREKNPYQWRNAIDMHWLQYCPYGGPGDRLWVRETWAPLGDFVGLDPGVRAIIQGCFYRADHPTGVTNDGGSSLRWHSGRFMFKKYARIWRDLTEVRVQRVQDITGDEVLLEGVGHNITPYEAGSPGFVLNRHAYQGALRQEFRQLWDSLNAKRGHSWESNPWVWVLSSRRVNGNEIHKNDAEGA